MAMQNIKTLAGVTLVSGFVRLTKDQARRRAHLVDAVDGEKDVYLIKGHVNFKAGEAFGYDGEIPKTWVGTKVEVESATKAQPAATGAQEAKHGDGKKDKSVPGALFGKDK